VTADVDSGATLMIAPQVSADGTNYTDADYEYVSSGIATQTYSRTLSADGTEYLRIPMAGEYLRVKMVTTGTLTVTVKATMRNN